MPYVSQEVLMWISVWEAGPPPLETSALLQKLSGLWEMGFSTSVSFNRDVLPQADMEGGVGS